MAPAVAPAAVGRLLSLQKQLQESLLKAEGLGFLGFGVPYFNTFFLKGNHYEKKYTFCSLVT